MRPLLLIVPVAALTFVAQGPAGGGPDPKPVAKDLAAKHARIGFRTLLETNSAFVRELVIETPEPAEVTVTVFDREGQGSGSIHETKRRPGQAHANVRLVLFLDYLRGGKEDPFIKRPCLKWAVSRLKNDGNWRSYASPSPPLAMPDAKSLDDVMTQKLQPGDYPYTGQDGPGREGLEVLSVGGCRILLRIGEPKPEE